MTATMATRPELSHKPIHWKWWIVLWVAFAAIEALLLANNAAVDSMAWRATRWFVGDREYYTWAEYHAQHVEDTRVGWFAQTPPPLGSKLYQRTQKIWEIAKTFGEPWTCF